MKNCLVTTLKSIINDSSLEKLGVLTLHVSSIENLDSEDKRLMRIAAVADGVIVRVTGDGKFSTSLSGLSENPIDSEGYYAVPVNETPYAYPLYFSNGNYDIEIYGKYWIHSILLPDTKTEHLISIDVDRVHDCYKLFSLKSNTSTMYGDISKLKTNTNLKVLNAYACGNLTGDIEALKNCTGINVYNTKVYGDVAHLSESINEFNASAAIGIYGDIDKFINATSVRIINTNISGTIKSLAEKAWKNGRRSGTITLELHGSKVEVMDGIKSNNIILITFSDNNIVIMNQNGSVTQTYNGSSWVKS